MAAISMAVLLKISQDFSLSSISPISAASTEQVFTRVKAKNLKIPLVRQWGLILLRVQCRRRLVDLIS